MLSGGKMPKKHSEKNCPSEKILKLYSTLLFSGREFSLTELADLLDCSKPTILRMIATLELNEKPIIPNKHGKQNYYKLAQPLNRPKASLNARDIQNLVLCRDMIMHMLPASIKQEIEMTLGYTTTLLTDFEKQIQNQGRSGRARRPRVRLTTVSKEMWSPHCVMPC